ncbi:MAG: Fic family protein [Magnetococcales bacterium]|nr:Fic family protein [Magnetococcales bacterium]
MQHLIRCVLSRHQFETIHPFLVGNGRVGRLLIALYFVSHGLLAKFASYLSAYLKKNRGACSDDLLRISIKRRKNITRASTQVVIHCQILDRNNYKRGHSRKRDHSRILVLAV